MQGLSDPEESVICGTVSAMTALCERGLFDLRLMMSALKQIVPYLIHPVSTSVVCYCVNVCFFLTTGYMGSLCSCGVCVGCC